MMKKMLVHNVPDEILLQICSSLTSHELYQLSLSCRALSRVAFEVLSRAIKLDYAYRDDGSLSHLNGFITKLERRSSGFLSDISIAHLSWPIGSELRRRMHHILSVLPNIQTLNLKEQFGSLRGFFIGSGDLVGLDENLYNMLLQIPSASTLRSLTISDTRITAHDILKLFAMRQLEHLSLNGFNYAMGIEPGEEVPHSQLQSLTISTSANPTGRHINIVLARTPKLRKFTWNFDLSSTLKQEAIWRALSPAAMGEALSPLRSTLEELYISMAPSRFRNDSTSLNLSNFLKLRILKVHEEVLFPSYNELGYVVFCHGLEAQLCERLPPNLEMLEIVFDRAGRNNWWATENHKWVFCSEGSERSRVKTPRHISITERSCAALGERELEDCALESPDEVKWAFDKAGATFKVFKRAREVPLS